MNLYEYCAKNLTEKEADQLYVQSLLYLTGATTAFTFQHNVKSLNLNASHGMSGKVFRLKLQDHDYFTVQVKFAILQYGTCPPKKARALAQQFVGDEIVQLDRVLTRRVITLLRAYCKQNEITSKMVCPEAMAGHKARFNGMLEDLNRHIKSKVYKKLRFLVGSQNYENRDFYSDLLCKALTTYYQLIPTNKTDAYVLNYMRRACTNHALNIIETYTTQKNGRLVNEGVDSMGANKYALICESENQYMGELSFDQRGSYEEDQSNIHVAKLLQRFEGWRRKALVVMCGLSQGFSLYLQRIAKINETQDHQDFQNRVSKNTYFSYIAKYCGVVDGALSKFVETLGEMLAQGEYA